MDRLRRETARFDRLRGLHTGPKRNNAVMDRHRDSTPHPAGEQEVVSDQAVAHYLRAIERADPAETPEPAAALAELLAARLEGSAAPEALRILESFAPTGDTPSGEAP